MNRMIYSPRCFTPKKSDDVYRRVTGNRLFMETVSNEIDTISTMYGVDPITLESIRNIRVSPKLERIVNPELVNYIESKIVPMYDANDKAHDRRHAHGVMSFSLMLANLINNSTEYRDRVNPDIVYTAAAFHDTGLPKGRKEHHLHSKEVFMNDSFMKQYFSPEDHEKVANAIIQHRTQYDGTRTEIHARVVADADNEASLSPIRAVDRIFSAKMEKMKNVTNLERMNAMVVDFNRLFDPNSDAPKWAFTSHEFKFSDIESAINQTKETLLDPYKVEKIIRLLGYDSDLIYTNSQNASVVQESAMSILEDVDLKSEALEYARNAKIEPEILEDVDKSLIEYIETNIIPLYDKNDPGHDRRHANGVIKYGLMLAKRINASPEYKDTPADPNIVYAAAAFHDIAVWKGREEHHQYAKEFFEADAKMKEFFSPEDFQKVADAIYLHRTKFDGSRKDIHTRIIAEADNENLLSPIRTVDRLFSFRLHTMNDATNLERMNNLIHDFRIMIDPNSDDPKWSEEAHEFKFPDIHAIIQQTKRDVLDPYIVERIIQALGYDTELIYTKSQQQLNENFSFIESTFESIALDNMEPGHKERISNIVELDALKRERVKEWINNTEIYVIHNKRSIKGLRKLWKKWDAMNDDRKEISEMKSREWFNMSNEEHLQTLLLSKLIKSGSERAAAITEATEPPDAPKNGSNRKKLYAEFVQWSKQFNPKNIFGSVFDKDVFRTTYPFVPQEMKYFYRMANPILCVLSGELTFFQLSELRKINEKNKEISKLLIFAATMNDLRVFNSADRGIYLATQNQFGKVELGDKLAHSFDIYLQAMIGKGDILNTPPKTP